MTDLVRRAEEIAAEVLFPAAMVVDGADRVPPEHLDLLAGEGFYALGAPPHDQEFRPVVEAFASGCLATTFVWLQHHGPLAAAYHSDLRETWFEDMACGRLRAGVALAGLRPGAGGVRVEPADDGDGFVLHGEAPWVTGWGQIDLVQLGAADAEGLAHFLLVDAEDSPTLRSTRQHIIAVQASGTVTLTFDGHRVPRNRLIGTQPLDEWRRGEVAGSVTNGYLALGVARRCLALIGPSPLDDQLEACRAALGTADPRATPSARAAAAELAQRSAAALVVHQGSRSILRSADAQRLVREAAFLLVFGTRPSIRGELLTRLLPYRAK